MKRWLVSFIVLSLLLLVVLPACGGGGDKEETTIPTSTPTVTPTTTPTPGGPVKIGTIGPWSGPMATTGGLAEQVMAVLQAQLKNMGGILGGREVKFVKGDDRGAIAETVAQAKKLILDDKVTILTMGGLGAQFFTAVANVAEELKVPYVPFGTIYDIAKYKYSACMIHHLIFINRIANFPIEVVKPKTVALFAVDTEDSHSMFNGVPDEGVVGARQIMEAAGIEVVYEDYFDIQVQDMSPFITKIKYAKPDLLITLLNNTAQAINLNKQVSELGGLGEIKYFSANEPGANATALKQPWTVGSYVGALWVPGSDDPGMKAFEDAFKQVHNRVPSTEYSYFYNDFWTAIKAVQLAGVDDREKVAEALRSGNLEWDSAWGHMRIGTDGKATVTASVAQVLEGGKIVKVWP